MADIIRLLIVEDAPDQKELYQDAVDEFNELHQGTSQIEIEIETNLSDAQQKLKSSDFDGAIVDLNLEGDEPGTASGNEVLKEIRGAHRFPVFVVTGVPDQLDDSLEENAFFKVRARDIDSRALLEELLRIYQTGITQILGARGIIESRLNEIFWEHISEGFRFWEGKNCEQPLLRHTLTHLIEYLALPGEEQQGEHYFEAEFYIVPPIKREIATGDIVQYENESYLLMTPACDLVVRSSKQRNGTPRKVSRVTLARMIPLERAELERLAIVEPGATDRKLNSFCIDVINNKIDQFAYLPPYLSFREAVVDFGDITCIVVDEYLTLERRATVADPFLKDIQSRFSLFYGRQGQPDLDKRRLQQPYR